VCSSDLDNIAVAKEIAKQAGIGEKISRISEIKSLPEAEQAEAIQKCDGIAEIYPEDKYWVVKTLQSKSKTTGMTGDGVNDAPALKQAELGIAVSGATDVAKAAASMVLVEQGTKVILEAIKISRETYQRMLTWTIKKIARSIQFMIIASLGFFWFQDVIISITGLMLLVVVNDLMTMTLAVDNARSTKNPNSWNVKNISMAAVFIGVLFAAIEIAFLLMGMNYFKMDLEQIRTLILISLIYTGQFGIIIVRERGFFWESSPSRTVLASITIAMAAFTVLALFGIGVKAIPAAAVAITLVASMLYVLAIDLPKKIAYKRLNIS
ncbi:MAG: HAD-IC family P-type ATPase, partial [Candidatus ainarchaeum sp.]|nr:HAD-IC family P-type ATPase [Candidatus ainarchaeum sp.]